jgi:hypothetical protein
MAISFVGSGTVSTGANPTVAVPAGVAAGDLLLIYVNSNGSSSPPTNWTTVTNAVFSLAIYSKIATSSESAVTLSAGGVEAVSVMVAYRGVGYIDAAGSAFTGTSTSALSPSVTTRFANDWVLNFYSVNSGSAAALTAPASTTQRVNRTNTGSLRGFLLVDELQATAGASTARTATLSVSNTWNTRAIALKEPQAFYIDPQNGLDANNGQTFATALKNISGATAAKGITAGDTVRIKEAPLYNTGVNATWTSVQQRGVSPFSNQAVAGATNATPIVCNTSLAHGYSTGDVVLISGGTGNTAVNGVWKITVTSSTQFSLDDSSGNGVYSGNSANLIPIFCRTIKTASALVKPIASFAPLRTASLGTRASWVGSANVSTSLIPGGVIGKGSVFDQIAINASFTTGKIAYYTLPATLNLSAYQQLSLFIMQQTGATLGGLTISLCSDTTGNTAVDTFTIPSTGATAIWCPFTFNKGSALGSSIQSISISRAVNNGAQTFNFNSIVACKAPTDVDALSNTSLITKNNGTEGAYAVGGFGGSDGTIVFLDNAPSANNLTVTGGAYYGTTETAGLWRYEPFNPWTLNGVALPVAGGNTYCTLTTNSGILNNPITYSGGWDSTNMSTRTGQTWFSNQNGIAEGIRNNSANYITTDTINYTRGAEVWVCAGSFTGAVVKNSNFTATSSQAFFSVASSMFVTISNCIFTNTNGTASIYIYYSSGVQSNPIIIDGCTISGSTGTNININTVSNGAPFINITNCSLNTASNVALLSGNTMYGNITNTSINYFNTTAFQSNSNIIGNINNLTIVPEPAGGGQIFLQQINIAPTTPQNVYTQFKNVTVNAPTTTYSQGTTNFNYVISNGANWRFSNCSFTPTNVVYTNGNLLYDNGGSYFYNCSGIPSTIAYSATVVQPYVNNAAFYSQDENNVVGNNKIYLLYALITSQTAVRNTPSGYAWAMAPTQTLINSTNPLKLKLASVAANGGSAVTISAYMRRTNTGLTMQLVCPANQPFGPSTDTVASMTAAANTWEQVSISFTPTQNAVYDIYAYCYGGSSFTGYVDDLGVSQ